MAPASSCSRPTRRPVSGSPASRIHPRGVRALRELGIDLPALAPCESGLGFAVHPEDGSAAIPLPYADEARGWSGEHASLVELLREHTTNHPAIHYEPHARALEIQPGSLAVQSASRSRGVRVRAALIVGADGRKSSVRTALGLANDRAVVSRMAGLRLRDVELPSEGFGHVLLGGPGPMLAYRISRDAVRLCIDVPLAAPADRAWLIASYRAALPASLREAFERELQTGELAWAINAVRPRSDYGRAGLALVGDAVGFQHPLTAVGLSLGLCDAVELARSPDQTTWERGRRQSVRAAELLAGALYEAFSAESETARAIRRGVYALWRRRPAQRARSMRILAAEEGQLGAFAATFARVASPALGGVAARRAGRGDFAGALEVGRELAVRGRWLVAGALRREARASEPARAVSEATLPSARAALEAAVARLAAEQREDGSFEGEVIWCPMLAAQYVLFAHAIGLRIPPDRRAALLRHFEDTQLPDGLWGLHAVSPPYLFTTTLVYVAARLLGAAPESPLLSRGLAFIRREDVLAIPSWGKLWLALVGLFDWRGVPPVVPELFALPRWLPVHPSRFYCHTRQIYLAMSALFARRFTAPDTERTREIRAELHPAGRRPAAWDAARYRLRRAELVTPPSLALRAVYRLLGLYDRHARPRLRARVLAELGERLRFELRSTDYTALSPVSGLLSILALHAASPEDEDVRRATQRLDAWMWCDASHGLRIAGARSATWDTSFALQALAEAPPGPSAARALERGAAFLRTQQIRQTGSGHRSAFRLDPRGGFCFAGVWHGWPVSDCTAEALDALARAGGEAFGRDHEIAAVRFLLRCQNPDGGFGSYEARRTRLGLEWLNPAEMFGESMTEHSYVECTGSCLAALAEFRRRHPDALSEEVGRAIRRAERRLRRLQRRDGSWRGVWGVQFVYGTLFGVRGLRAAGAAPDDPALRRACAWLRARQRPDGGWGEHHSGCLRGQYVEHDRSQVLQTAWALMALLEAQDPDREALARGARFLLGAQQPDGAWPREDPAGLFFQTALLEYALYRVYFPLWALARYEARRVGEREA